MTDPFKKVRKPCSWCRRAVLTQAKVRAPLCHGCRAKRRNLFKGRDSMRGLGAANRAALTRDASLKEAA